MRILIDTDVLLDLATDRKPFAEPAVELFRYLERHPGLGWIAWHSASNFYYIFSGTQGTDGARRFLEELLRFVRVAETTTESLRYATQLAMADFEDAMQVAAATACGAEAIVTRNLKDYRSSPIPTLSPDSIVDELTG